MIDVYIGDLTPGTFVINVKKENEWGIGQVQSSINNIITINFENVGKKTINPKEVELKIININGTNWSIFKKSKLPESICYR